MAKVGGSEQRENKCLNLQIFTKENYSVIIVSVFPSGTTAEKKLG